MASFERIRQLGIIDQSNKIDFKEYVKKQFDKLGKNEAKDIYVPDRYKYSFESFCDNRNLPCYLIDMDRGCFSISKNYDALYIHEEER